MFVDVRVCLISPGGLLDRELDITTTTIQDLPQIEPADPSAERDRSNELSDLGHVLGTDGDAPLTARSVRPPSDTPSFNVNDREGGEDLQPEDGSHVQVQQVNHGGGGSNEAGIVVGAGVGVEAGTVKTPLERFPVIFLSRQFIVTHNLFNLYYYLTLNPTG
jgi:hypothetical protein